MDITPILAAFLIASASLGGVFFVWKGAGAWVEKNLRYLTSFAAGVFFITGYSLLIESLHLTESLILILLGGFGGALFLELASNIIPGIHHHHGVEEKDDCGDGPHSRIDARRMLLGDAIHNIGDGVLLVSAFLFDVWFGVTTALAIFLHEFVQEVAEFFVLKEAGFSTRGALWRNFLISTTIFIGLILGYLVVDIDKFTGPFLAFAAGGFFYIVFRDLLPSVVKTSTNKKKTFSHLTAILIGVMIMLGLSTIFSHSHEGEEDHIHEEGHPEEIHEEDLDHIDEMDLHLDRDHYEEHHDDLTH